MADGDDREETSDRKPNDDSNIPDVQNLEIAEQEDPEDIEQEYLALDSQLNQLDQCLDSLEARNDDLMARLKAFLQDSSSSSSSEHTQPEKGAGNGGKGGSCADVAESDSSTEPSAHGR